MAPSEPTNHRGDDGNSDLIGGTRLRKDHPVFECLGQLDELNSAIGLLRAQLREAATETAKQDPVLREIQLTLGRLMAWIAQPTGAGQSDAPAAAIAATDVVALESLETALRSEAEIGKRFVVPGDTTVVSALADGARAKCRTAERAFVRFRNETTRGKTPGEPAAPDTESTARRYLNRLSTYLFALARHLDEPSGQ